MLKTIKFLSKIPKKDAQKIIDKISLLSTQPNAKELDTKKLVSMNAMYHLRIGRIRVMYEIDETKKTLYIRDIDFRGNVY